MSKYKVLHDFTDLQDGNKVYRKDEPFPRPANKKITKKRIEELSSKKNKRNKVLIEEVKEQAK